MRDLPDTLLTALAWLIGISFCVAFFTGALWAWPQYRVWQQEMRGQADLARATHDRKIRIEEAKAEKESAALLAEAEVERAHGVAEANKIIADGLGGPEGYLRYLWIQQVANASNDTIYVPTEAGIPILEAGRLPNRSGPAQ